MGGNVSRSLTPWDADRQLWGSHAVLLLGYTTQKCFVLKCQTSQGHISLRGWIFNSVLWENLSVPVPPQPVQSQPRASILLNYSYSCKHWAASGPWLSSCIPPQQTTLLHEPHLVRFSGGQNGVGYIQQTRTKDVETEVRITRAWPKVTQGSQLWSESPRFPWAQSPPRGPQTHQSGCQLFGGIIIEAIAILYRKKTHTHAHRKVLQNAFFFFYIFFKISEIPLSILGNSLLFYVPNNSLCAQMARGLERARSRSSAHVRNGSVSSCGSWVRLKLGALCAEGDKSTLQLPSNLQKLVFSRKKESSSDLGNMTWQ